MSLTNGDGSSASASNVFTVLAGTTIAIASNHNPSVVGQQVTYTATVTPDSPGTLTGTVAFKDGASPITCGGGSSVFDGSTATCTQTYASTSGSPHSITAVYSGDTSFAPSTSDALSQSVDAAATTTTVSSSVNPSVFGQSVTLTATIAAVSPGAGAPSGTVNFKDGGSTIGTCSAQTVSGSGPYTATCTTSGLAVGAHTTITAVYSGDTDFSGSTSVDFTQTVDKAATTTVITSSANPSVTGQPVTYTATVTASSPGAGTPTGTVNFRENATAIPGCGARALDGSGQATCVVSYDASGGNHTQISGVYSSDADFSASTSVDFTQTVDKAATTTVITSSVNPSVTGQSVTYTATVTVSSPGAGTPTGTVNFRDDTTTITGCGARALDGSGQATCVVSYDASGGNHTQVNGVYSSDADFSASTSVDFTQTVNKAATTTAVSSSSVNPSVFGQSVTLTATVAVVSPGAGAPSGTVSFKDGVSTIGTCSAQAVSGSGPYTATCTTSGLAVGAHTAITAVYSGDGRFPHFHVG